MTETKVWSTTSRFQRHESDTGSPEYQVHKITEKIWILQQHLKANYKDYDAKRALLKLVQRRRKHLKYLKLNDLDRYVNVKEKTWLKV